MHACAESGVDKNTNHKQQTTNTDTDTDTDTNHKPQTNKQTANNKTQKTQNPHKPPTKYSNRHTTEIYTRC